MFYVYWTPLHWAVERESEDLVKLLIDMGANPYKADYEGLTPEIMATRKGKSSLVKLISASGFPQEPVSNGACSLGFLDFCRPRGEDSDYMKFPRRYSGAGTGDILHV